MNWFESFEARHFELKEATIYAHVSMGSPTGRPALLLLHGFPQCHAMWNRVARHLAQDFFLVMPDLRGYGDSSMPPGQANHANYSKRALAQDMVELMEALGIDRFHLCGHDRGGRVAHRLALDHPLRVDKLCVIDIAPTLDMYNGAGMKRPYMEFARAYYHWFHLIQPAPLPETMIGGDPLAYLHAKLGGWGASGLAHIEAAALAEYERCFNRPEAIHSACEDYRASAGIDLEHDRQSRVLGEQIACDILVLWGAKGVIHTFFDPLQLWQAQCSQTVTGQAMEAGHFIPEQRSEETAGLLARFFGAASINPAKN